MVKESRGVLRDAHSPSTRHFNLFLHYTYSPPHSPCASSPPPRDARERSPSLPPLRTGPLVLHPLNEVIDQHGPCGVFVEV